MGYSKSKATARKQIPTLKILKEKNGDFRLPSSAPSELAYKLREAFSIIENNPQSFSEFTELKSKFNIRVGEGCLIFTRKYDLTVGAPIDITPAGLGVAEVLNAELEVHTPMQVVGYCIKHKAETMVFPGFDHISESWTEIYKWTSRNGYFINEINPLTISKHKGEKEWQPST